MFGVCVSSVHVGWYGCTVGCSSQEELHWCPSLSVQVCGVPLHMYYLYVLVFTCLSHVQERVP